MTAPHISTSAASNWESELAVRNLAARYSLALTRRDFDTLRDCFTDDATWQTSGPFERSIRGRDAFISFVQEGQEGFEFLIQHIGGGLIEINGDTGTGQWSVTETGRSLDGLSGLTSMGIYHDRYQREHGAWKFAARHYSALWWSNIVPDGTSFRDPFAD